MKKIIPGHEQTTRQDVMVGLLRNCSVFICHLGLSGEKDCERNDDHLLPGKKEMDCIG